MKNLKRINFLFIFFLLSLFTGGVYAYDFDDTTKVEAFYQTSPSGVWLENIGSDFDTLGANLSGNTLTLFSNWNPTKDFFGKGSGFGGVITADLFIRDWSKGITYSIRLDKTNQGAFFINPSLNDILYSQDLLGNSNLEYAGVYDQANGFKVPVWTVGYALYSLPVIWSNGQVSVDLSKLNLNGDDWSFLWGTGTCGNDVITGNVYPTVPEPGVMLLLGVGLIGLGGLRRKLKN